MQAPNEFSPSPGMAYELAPSLRRVLASNPSQMTYRGTNTYLLGNKDIAVIDPGPLNELHLDAILEALKPHQRISHIFVTHTHLDHSALAAPLSARTGAPVLAFGGPQAGRSAVMSNLAQQGLAGGGEGIDSDFRPNVELADGEKIASDCWELEVIHTPGHLGNHIALAWRGICFTGDHVMGWASTLVSPPDGDLTDYMAACRCLRARDFSVFHPGHGAPIASPVDRLNWLISYRMVREAQILDALAHGPATVQQLVLRIYTATPKALLPAAERNVFAQLIDLAGRSRVAPYGQLSVTSRFRRLK